VCCCRHGSLRTTARRTCWPSHKRQRATSERSGVSQVKR
jgi:hypothetical protein